MTDDEIKAAVAGLEAEKERLETEYGLAATKAEGELRAVRKKCGHADRFIYDDVRADGRRSWNCKTCGEWYHAGIVPMTFSLNLFGTEEKR